MLQSGGEPYYPLKEVKEKMHTGQFRINENAITGAKELGFTIQDIKKVILSLEKKNYYKNSESKNRPEVIDFYKNIRYQGETIYLHFYIRDKEPEVLVINSFKEQ